MKRTVSSRDVIGRGRPNPREGVWRGRPRAFAALGFAGALLGMGCRCSSEPASTAPVASAPAATPDCQRQSVLLTLAPSDAVRQPAEALDPSVELPFATEPGMAIAQAGGFYATGQRHESRGAVA